MNELIYTSPNGQIVFSLQSGIVISRIEALDSQEVKFSTTEKPNGIGDKVESQRVTGKKLRVIGSIIGDAADARRRLNHIIAPLQEGTLTFNGAYQMRVYPQKTPQIERYATNPAFTFILYAPQPFWGLMEWQSTLLLGLVRRFRFPFTMNGKYRFSEFSRAAYANAHNSGEVPVSWKATLYAVNEVRNPYIENFATGQRVKLWHVMEPGAGVTIDCTGDELSVTCYSADGTQINGFTLLDLDSDAFELQPGDNLIRCGCDEEGTALRAQLQWQPAISGV